jgi:hypothetical protein
MFSSGGAHPHREVGKMRVARMVIMVAAVVAVILPTAAARAGVDNGGCPPERSNWTLLTHDEWYAAMLTDLKAANDAGYTLGDLAAIYGFEPTLDGAWQWYEAHTSTLIDKNQDGTICRADYFGRTHEIPWVSSTIDNVLPH